jgi:glutathione S-transferase
VSYLDPERFGFGFMTEDHVKTVRKALNDDVLPEHLANLEKLLQDSPSGWIAGGAEPTIADFILVPRLQWLVEPHVNEGISPHLLDNYPKLKGMMQKLMDLPAVVEYYRTHEQAHPK